MRRHEVEETEEERGEDIRRLGTMFIQDTGYHYLARGRDGNAIGIIYVPFFDADIVVGVRVIGHSGAGFELLTQAQVETYREFELIPDLRYMDRREVRVKTVSGGEVLSYQLNYADPSQDYDPKSEEARTVRIPPGALTVSGKIGK